MSSQLPPDAPPERRNARPRRSAAVETAVGLVVLVAFVAGAAWFVSGVLNSSIAWYYWAAGLAIVVGASALRRFLRRRLAKW